jgi:nitrile hydratase|nr:nthA [Aeromicrobium sp.]
MAEPTRNEHVALRVKLLEQLLLEQGLIADGEVDAVLDDFLATAMPLNGARLVAKAWLDADFARQLVADGSRVAAGLGMRVAPLGQPEVQLRVVANTDAVHNVLVCTLCSCYPLRLLGTPPTWYKSLEYRSRIVRDPRATLAEFGLHLGPDVDIQVWDSTSHVRYMVLPQRPEGTDGLSEAELIPLIRRDALLGVAEVPATVGGRA